MRLAEIWENTDRRTLAMFAPGTAQRRQRNRSGAFIMAKNWKPTLTAATDEQTRDPHFVHRVAINLWCLRYQERPASRRTIPDLCANVWRDFEGKAITHEGADYEVPEVDAILGTENDPDFTWVRDFMGYALEMPTQTLPSKSRERVRYLDLTIRAGGPNLWRGQYY